MREIKFRAWDLEIKKMYKQKIVEDRTIFWNTDTTTLFKFEECLHRDNPLLMQFTGLKDKKGKEIYEGDILILHHGRGVGRGTSWEKYISVVVWDEVNGGFKNETKIRRKIDTKEVNQEYFGDSTIIGNIYENPELLKEETSHSD